MTWEAIFEQWPLFAAAAVVLVILLDCWSKHRCALRVAYFLLRVACFPLRVAYFPAFHQATARFHVVRQGRSERARTEGKD